MRHARLSGGICWLIGAWCLVFTLVAVAIGGRDARAQQQAIAVFPQIQRTNADVTVDVVAQNAANLGAFQMVLSWDPAVVSLVKISDGGFLGQTGRKPLCPQPVIDKTAVRFTCVTLAPPTTPAAASPGTPIAVGGVAGNGVLAHAQFHIIKNGTPEFHLSRVKLVDPIGTELTSKVSDGAALQIKDESGGNGWIIGVAVAGGVVLVLLVALAMVIRRRRRPSNGRPASEPVSGPER